MSTSPAVEAQVSQLRALLALKTEPNPPIPPGVEFATVFEFTPATPPVVLFGSVSAGTIFSSASVLIDTAFNDPSATLELGTTLNPALLLAPGDSRLPVDNTYATELLVVIDAPDVLQLRLSLGASTLGRG
jgi:hypothetical protein